MNIPNHRQEIVALKTLKGAEYNPRTISDSAFEALKLQIKTYGLVQPLVVRKEDGTIIGGHQRYAALKSVLQEQGASPSDIESSPVPVILLSGLTEEKTRLLNLALNKISGEWDYEKLSTIFDGLNTDISTDLIQLSGFSIGEVDDIMGLLSGPNKLEAPSQALDDEIAEGLAKQARRFNFALESDGDANFVRATLRSFGMTGPGNAEEALVKVMHAAASTLSKPDETEVI